MCIFDRFNGKDGGQYQVGYLCVKVHNVKTLQLLIKFVYLYCYSGYSVFENFPW